MTALLFVALAGTSIVVLTRRVEERTRKLADARDRLEEELNSAHELQMGLMPKQAPATTMLDIAGRCQPAAQVGGDFFQYFELEEFSNWRIRELGNSEIREFGNSKLEC